MRPYKPPAVVGRRVTIDLPYLTTEQALLLFEVLGEVATAIWDAHDPEIGDLVAEQAFQEAAIRDYEMTSLDDLDSDTLPPF